MKFALALFLAALAAQAAPLKPVKTEGGLLSGVPAANGTIVAYKGVPFAAPPVGDLRWKAPQPALKWNGVKAADRFGANCVQNIVDSRAPWTHEFMAHGETSEDCLYLNIWTPAAASREKRAVFVYLHGGANTEGSGSVPVYDGEGLASKGLVMVTVNYRLGVFGFFTHPELTRESAHNSSGNYALLDQLAALRWVHDNIAAFGGDPGRVTVAGQSAGAADIALLTVSPLAKGLFQREILESGGSSFSGFGGARPLAAQEAEGVKFAELKGAHSLADLRALSAKDLFAPVKGAPRFGPVLDGYVLQKSAKDAFAAGMENDVPTLAGSNADENGASPQPNVDAARFEAQAKQRYGSNAEAFLKLYPASDPNTSARDQARVSILAWAAARQATAKTPTYLYFWDHRLPGPESDKYGAFHTSEVPYVLNTLGKSDRAFTADDRRIADTLSSYWANFAKTGNPNGKGLPPWPSVTDKPDMVMEIGDKDAPVPAAGSTEKLKVLREALGTR
ncbi:MAG: carboxylesterase family protein [Acidobacteriota bacterium]|nr:carboxylesterase family protein [Acidobacteriota bacterium]